MVIAISLSLKRIYVGGIYYKEYKEQRAKPYIPSGAVQPITVKDEEEMNKNEGLELNQNISSQIGAGNESIPPSPNKRERAW